MRRGSPLGVSSTQLSWRYCLNFGGCSGSRQRKYYILVMHLQLSCIPFFVFSTSNGRSTSSQVSCGRGNLEKRLKSRRVYRGVKFPSAENDYQGSHGIGDGPKERGKDSTLKYWRHKVSWFVENYRWCRNMNEWSCYVEVTIKLDSYICLLLITFLAWSTWSHKLVL